ncbi:MAG TPA: copper homeostasis membrane protein CopD [Sphingobium sp.]
MDWAAVAIRFGTYAALSLIAGVPLFLCLSLGMRRAGAVLTAWRGPYLLLLTAAMPLSALALLSTTAMMAGTSLFPVDGEMALLVISATPAGKAIVTRLLLCVLLIALMLSRRSSRLRSITALGTIAAMSLVWSGHAAASEGMAGWLHLGGDALHILAAALWIGGMACLLMSLRPSGVHLAEPMLRAFAWVGGVIVALLIVTGLLNMGMTIGFDRLLDSLDGLYGKLLALKIGLFLVMLALAANNRFRLSPAFERDRLAALPTLRHAIAIEIGIAMLILAAVAWLGMIAPVE